MSCCSAVGAVETVVRSVRDARHIYGVTCSDDNECHPVRLVQLYVLLCPHFYFLSMMLHNQSDSVACSTAITPTNFRLQRDA